MRHAALLVVAFSVALGCGSRTNLEDYRKTIKSAKDVLGVAVEMEQLFPEAEHFITHYGFEAGPRTWNTLVFFGDRYQLQMTVDVKIDYSNCRIIDVVGSPEFFVLEVKEIEKPSTGEIIANYGDQTRFKWKEWDKVYRSKGDFSTIGFPLKAEGVKYFDEYVEKVRGPFVHVSLTQ